MNEILLTKLRAMTAETLTGAPGSVFTQTQISSFLEKLKSNDEELTSVSLSSFIKFLLDEPFLSETRLDFPHRSLLRFLKSNEDANLFELAQSLAPHGYLSHRSAIEIHGLSKKNSQTFYVNEEQTPKPENSSDMQQSNIDRSFRKSPRVSNNFISIEGNKFYVLNGKNTKNAGAIDYELPNGAIVRVTGVERTLIDIVVRPFYAGGVEEVITAYQRAISKINPDLMIKLLARCHHAYPYHQAIGFYMERAGGYEKDVIQIFGNMPRDYDFYLDNKMKDPNYSEKWRIYYPRELD